MALLLACRHLPCFYLPLAFLLTFPFTLLLTLLLTGPLPLPLQLCPWVACATIWSTAACPSGLCLR